VAVYPHVGVEIVRHVVVRGGQQHADAGTIDELAQVEGKHFRQRAIEIRRKFVGHQE